MENKGNKNIGGTLIHMLMVHDIELTKTKLINRNVGKLQLGFSQHGMVYFYTVEPKLKEK
jgi:hypothetical protein